MQRRAALRKRRMSLGLTQQQAAEKLGISGAYYGMIEQGSRTPRLAMAFKIASILNSQVEEVFPEVVLSNRVEASNG